MLRRMRNNFKGAIARKRQVFEQMAQNQKRRFIGWEYVIGMHLRIARAHILVQTHVFLVRHCQVAKSSVYDRKDYESRRHDEL